MFCPWHLGRVGVGFSVVNMPLHHLSVVIQAGGESKRMGQDKGLALFLGQPLAARLAQRLAPLSGEILITTNQPEDYRFLNLPLIPDKLPGCGALGGLYTALSAASGEAVAVVACDMPFASQALLRLECDLLLESGADLVIPRLSDDLEPFHAVYRRLACLPHIQAALEAGQRRVDAWFPHVCIRHLSADEIAPHDPQGLTFWNVNTPEELQAAQQVAQQYPDL
jgi:molybdopterin-guanine dinucleotide biosynthesis protein A